MRVALPFALLAASAFPPTVNATPTTFTVREARSAPVTTLAERALGAAGRLIREASRPLAEPFPGQPFGLRMLEFATAPRASRSPGLCVADLVFISFSPAPGAREGDPDPPSVITGLSTGKAYRIVGDPSSSSAEWTDDDTRRLNALCEGSTGRVLWQPAESRTGFFNGSNGSGGFWETHAAVAAQALHETSRRARSNAPLEIICAPDVGVQDDRLCANPRALLAAIDPQNLGYVQFDSCRFHREMRCINLSFPRWLDGLGSQRQIAISIETDQSESSRDIRVGEIVTIRIEGQTIVY